MPTAELELPAERVSSVSQETARDSSREIHSPLFSLHPTEAVVGRADFEPSESFSTSAWDKPRRFRFVAKGEETVQVDTWLQLKSLEQVPSPRLVMETPEDVHGLQVQLSVDLNTQKLNLSYSIEMPGLPVDKALHYTRFLKVLYSEGTLTLLTLEPLEAAIGDLPLPVPTKEVEKTDLEWHIQLYERLKDIGRATGTEMVCPNDIQDEDLRDLERIEDIISAGWIVDSVSGFRLWLEEEGALDLLNHDRTSFEGFSTTTDEDHFSLFGADISLGPAIRWIAQVQLDTPLENIREWLQSRPEHGQTIETNWSTPQNSSMHAIFYGWPKPSLERVQEDIAALERKYGMGWRGFKRLWEKNRTQHIDDAALWASLIDARDYLKQQS